MAEQIDIILDTDYDLTIQNGDFFIDDANQQHIEQILIADKGWWSQNPFLGVNIRSQINGTIDNKFLQKVRLNLEADNFKVKTVKFTDKLEIEAKK
jgi:hypothetical protein